MTISLNLPESLEDKIERAINQGEYSSKSEFIRDSIRRRSSELGLSKQIEANISSRVRFEDQPKYFLSNHGGLHQSFLFSKFDPWFEGYSFRSNTTYMSINEFRRFLSVMKDELGLNIPSAAFSVNQEEANWFGKGGSEFIDCIKDQANRYAAAEETSWYKTELGLLVARSNYGLFSISVDVPARDNPETIEVRLSWSVEGIPPYMHEVVGVIDRFNLSLRPSHQFESGKPESEDEKFKYDVPKSLKKYTVDNTEIKLEVIDELASKHNEEKSEEFVEAILAKNPYYNNFTRFEEDFPVLSKLDRFSTFVELENILVHIRQHSKLEDNVDYSLQELALADGESLFGRHGILVKAIGNW